MSRPARIPGFSYLGPYRYFLTLCTFDRRCVFRESLVASTVLSQFRTTARELDFAILAYCLMPDHAHLLIEGMTDAADLQRFVKRAKQRSGQAYAHQTHRRLWQEGYYDGVLRAEEDSRAIARYVIENPVRAGLVDDPTFIHIWAPTSGRWRELLDRTR